MDKTYMLIRVKGEHLLVNVEDVDDFGVIGLEELHETLCSKVH